MGPSTQTTSSQASPYGPAQPAIKLALRDAMRAYRQGVGTNTGSNVVPMAKDTTQAYNSMRQGANANMGGQGLSGQYQNVINNGGYNDQMKQAVDQYSNLANSSYDFNANPGSQGVLDASIRDASNAVNLNASAAGRYGSGVHEGVMARQIGDLSNSFRQNDYNNWLGRRDQATAALGNLGQAGINNLGSAYQGMQAPAQTKLGIGAAYEDLYKRQLDDRTRVQNEPWNQIGRLMNIGNLGGQYQTSVSQAPGPSPLLQGLGYASLGVGLGGMTGLL